MSPYAGSSRLGATPKRPSHPTLRVRLVDRHTMQVKPRPSYAWLVFGLLMAWLALAPLGPSAGKAADAPEGAWVTLDGQRVLEIRIAAGAGTAAETAGRARRNRANWSTIAPSIRMRCWLWRIRRIGWWPCGRPTAA